MSETVRLNIGDCYLPVISDRARLKTSAIQLARRKTIPEILKIWAWNSNDYLQDSPFTICFIKQEGNVSVFLPFQFGKVNTWKYISLYYSYSYLTIVCLKSTGNILDITNKHLLP